MCTVIVKMYDHITYVKIVRIPGSRPNAPTEVDGQQRNLFVLICFVFHV